MDFVGSLRKGVEIVKLNGPVAAAVGADEQALQPGLVIVAVSGLAAGIAGLAGHGGVGGLISGPIGALIGYAIGVGILHLVATILFGGKGDYLSLLRAESHAAILGWAGIIPFVGWLVGLWHLPVSVVILQNVYGMPREKAIATVAVIAGFFLLLGLVAVFFFGALMGGFMTGMRH
ncbi:MAG TPA: YIP1 family protein [Candidatus Methanoperedens sp.]|nr:YIP1 family protein [Candidatus Methanoperedens sp.]